jgi:hypothetical protein
LAVTARVIDGLMGSSRLASLSGVGIESLRVRS